MLDQLVPGFKFNANPYFSNTPPAGYQTQTPSRFINCSAPSRSYHPGPAVNGVVAVTAGPGINEFIWLPYIAGWITWVRAEGRPILTGKMSGCWLARALLRGQPVFMHIGTDDTDQNLNNAVKNAIKIARGTGDLRIISAFNPAAAVKANPIFAAQTPDNRFLAIACKAVGNTMAVEVKQTKTVQGSVLPF